MPLPGLTERQNEALEFIRSYIEANRTPPTLVEIGATLGIRSTNGVSKLLNGLEKKGHIERDRNRARSIRVVEDGLDALFSPTAGVPKLTVANRASSSNPPRDFRVNSMGELYVDPKLLGRAHEHACLIVRAGDDGMNQDGIRKGDLLLVEEMDWRRFRPRDLVVALMRDDFLARRFEVTNGQIQLNPSNRSYAPDFVSPKDPEVHPVGRVLALFRTVR